MRLNARSAELHAPTDRALAMPALRPLSGWLDGTIYENAVRHHLRGSPVTERAATGNLCSGCTATALPEHPKGAPQGFTPHGYATVLRQPPHRGRGDLHCRGSRPRSYEVRLAVQY